MTPWRPHEIVISPCEQRLLSTAALLELARVNLRLRVMLARARS